LCYVAAAKEESTVSEDWIRKKATRKKRWMSLLSSTKNILVLKMELVKEEGCVKFDKPA